MHDNRDSRKRIPDTSLATLITVERRDPDSYAEPISGAILIDNCTSLDAAIQARQQLIARVQSAVRRNARPIEGDATW
jgi:hypothetical protein